MVFVALLAAMKKIIWLFCVLDVIRGGQRHWWETQKNLFLSHESKEHIFIKTS